MIALAIFAAVVVIGALFLAGIVRAFVQMAPDFH